MVARGLNHDRAEDVAQEVAARAWRARPSFTTTDEMFTWASTVARNLVIDDHRKQGRVEPAREVLAPVYGRFTEGHDTADLIVARNLLENMNQLQPAMR